MYRFFIILIIIVILIWCYNIDIPFTDIKIKYPLSIINNDVVADADIISNDIKLNGTNKIIIPGNNGGELTLDWDDLFHLTNNYIIGGDIKKNNDDKKSTKLCIGPGSEWPVAATDNVENKNICIDKDNIKELTDGWPKGTIIAFIGQPAVGDKYDCTKFGFKDHDKCNHYQNQSIDEPLPDASYYVPMGWIICDGVKRNFEDGSSITPPNLKGLFIKGATPSNFKIQGGSDSRVLTTDNIPKHSHIIKINHKAEEPVTIKANKPLKNISINSSSTSVDSTKPSALYGPSSYNKYIEESGISGEPVLGPTTNPPNSHNIEPLYYTVIYIMKHKIIPTISTPITDTTDTTDNKTINEEWTKIQNCCKVWNEVNNLKNGKAFANKIRCTTDGGKVYNCDSDGEKNGWAWVKIPKTNDEMIRYNKQKILKFIPH